MRSTSGTSRPWLVRCGSFLARCAFFVGIAVGPAAADDLISSSTTERGGKVRFEPLADESKTVPMFRLKPHVFDFRAARTNDGGWLRLVNEETVTFPSPVVTEFGCNNTVHCEYFAPRGKTPAAGVVVLHILGGDFELSRAICRALAINGVGALFVKMPYYGPRRPAGKQIRMISADLDQTTQGMRQAVLDIRRATAWLGAQPEIDAHRLGVTGISLGGIIAALATAAEPQLSKACLVLAGGDLMKIIRESDEMAGIRKQWAQEPFDADKVAAQLRTVDPLTYAGKLKHRKLLMLNARQDRVIPPDCTQALWEAVGRPEIEWWNADHYSAAWYLPHGMSRMITFFRKE